MTAQRLSTIRVEKPWGREILWPGFDNPDGARIGEIWFEAQPPADPDLMVKYLFTSEKLSIQVHEDDAAAQADGRPRGKDEAWVVLAAEPDARIALGTKQPVSREALRAAAIDGSIEALVDWKPVAADDVIYSPARTVHAIGAGLTLIEVQQNVDLTYRLFDYERPRELQLDAGLAVSDPVPFAMHDARRECGNGRTILCEGAKFVLERWTWQGERQLTLPAAVTGWLIAVSGTGAIDGAAFASGQCWMIDGVTNVNIAPASEILFAYPQPNVADLFR